ncbi:hypothetical protein C0208_03335 [Moraxella catarrhalis]|nr:hypothetical protein [Moraxella catarrhalis]
MDKLCGFLGITMGEIFEYVPDAPAKH